MACMDDYSFEDRLHWLVLRAQESVCSALAMRPVSLVPDTLATSESRGDLALCTPFAGGVLLSGVSLGESVEVTHYWYRLPTEPDILARTGLS